MKRIFTLAFIAVILVGFTSSCLALSWMSVAPGNNKISHGSSHFTNLNIASTGEKFPHFTDPQFQYTYGDYNKTWLNPYQISADDNYRTYPSATSLANGEKTKLLVGCGYDFSSIPDGAVILGVVFRYVAYYTWNSPEVTLVSLIDANPGSEQLLGDNQAAVPNTLTTDQNTVYTKGGAGFLWGATLTPAIVKDAYFGVAVGMTAVTDTTKPLVDYFTLEVFYYVP